MRKKLRLILLLGFIALVVPGVRAQEKGLMVSFGGATFQMDDMKYYQEYILTQYPVEGAIISSFPPYTAASFNLFTQKWSATRIGAGYVYTVAGAKSDYTDYSGNINTLFNAASHRLGAFVYYTFMGREKLDLSLFGRLDANISRIEVSSSIYALGLSSYMLDKYKSFSPNASAGLELLYNFQDFALGIEGGYLVDFPGKLSGSESGSKLRDPAASQKILTSNWTGWRVAIKGVMWLRNMN